MNLSLKESFLVSISDFWSRKLRSFVIILSIVLGTMTIVVVQSMVKGVKDTTLEWILERGGMTRIDITSDRSYRNPRNLRTFLNLREFNQFKDEITHAYAISPELMSYGRISYQNNSLGSSIAGVLPDFLKTEDWDVDSGRFISNFDVVNYNDTIVIGSTISSELFGNKEPIGEYVRYQERVFQVIGVMGKREFSHNGFAQQVNLLEYLNRRAYIPITSMIQKLSVEDRIETITVHAISIDRTPILKNDIENFFLNIRNNEPVFRVDSALEDIESAAPAERAFQVIFMIISLISLLVAGIVIMNIMMASIKERTREIGIRMAVGASRLDIFLQFIIQTLIITILGAVIGVISALSILNIISDYIGINMSGSFSLVSLSIAIAVGVGLFFGVLPALKASKLDPVKCLAYE